jgi:prevent-host-death family protein
MKRISAGKFKSRCLALIEEVHASGEPVVATKHGKPVVKLVSAKAADDSIFGYMAGKMKIVGDIVAPATPIGDWEALKRSKRGVLEFATDSLVSPGRSAAFHRST